MRSWESESAFKAERASISRKKGFSESRIDAGSLTSELGPGLFASGAGSDFGMVVSGAEAAGITATGTPGGTIGVSLMACVCSIAVSGVVLLP